MSGLMQILLLKVSAHITEQLGMAPGGEFREAFKEVSANTHALPHLHCPHGSDMHCNSCTRSWLLADVTNYQRTINARSHETWNMKPVNSKDWSASINMHFFLFYPIQAGKVPFCKFHLGDRPIPVTFKRAIAALSLWQKARLAWGLCFLSDPIRYKSTPLCMHSDHKS